MVLDQLTPAEAARALGVTQATVRVRLHRARRALRGSAPAQRPVRETHLEVAR
ncbi:sigma factor-like helix-turn-helix DNA-binding protein [Streptomyces antarcticus]|uniref:sigma factor-like helix-turn-helix DNA-binding protein n=1 Tax=Streptomyces antarcticus TaxID=2996458 RepID=UPI00226DD360|nr:MULTISPECIES: sigma factor-like helix-turn-helix DNA-binding protein [unclassified Streptomyces]MCY0945291.1 hypothetical protein [Streptomyces sp. H34-AA3]MCY0952626.1 hypothetical protein [Streptomyces sp. H27-S2]